MCIRDRLEAKDSYGNITQKTISITFTDTQVKERTKAFGKIRFISEKYYGKNKAGGLMENSRWLNDPEFNSLLRQALAIWYRPFRFDFYQQPLCGEGYCHQWWLFHFFQAGGQAFQGSSHRLCHSRLIRGADQAHRLHPRDLQSQELCIRSHLFLWYHPARQSRIHHESHRLSPLRDPQVWWVRLWHRIHLRQWQAI